jgi:hypothetical protein
LTKLNTEEVNNCQIICYFVMDFSQIGTDFPQINTDI